MQRGTKPRSTLEKRNAPQEGDAVDQPSWESSLLDHPDAKFFCENGGHAHKKKKRTTKKNRGLWKLTPQARRRVVRIKTFFRPAIHLKS
jgi:hypothetical protein